MVAKASIYTADSQPAQLYWQKLCELEGGGNNHYTVSCSPHVGVCVRNLHVCVLLGGGSGSCCHGRSRWTGGRCRHVPYQQQQQQQRVPLESPIHRRGDDPGAVKLFAPDAEPPSVAVFRPRDAAGGRRIVWRQKDGGMQRPSLFQMTLTRLLLQLIRRNGGKWRLLLEVCVCVLCVLAVTGAFPFCPRTFLPPPVCRKSETWIEKKVRGGSAEDDRSA